MPLLDLCKLLPNQQGGRLVAEVGYITHDFLASCAQCGLEVLDAVEVQEGLDGVWAGIHRLVWLGDALDLADGVTLEVVWAELFRHHWHVCGEVVVHVESRVGGVGVKDGNLDWHCDVVLVESVDEVVCQLGRLSSMQETTKVGLRLDVIERKFGLGLL